MNFLAQNSDVQNAFGTVAPPPGMDFGGNDPVGGFGMAIAFGIRLFIIIASLFLLIYLLWGAFDWITSGGEKERIQKAQNKITNAVIGLILVFVALVGFNLIAGNLLGIITPGPNGWEFKLPTLGQ